MFGTFQALSVICHLQSPRPACITHVGLFISTMPTSPPKPCVVCRVLVRDGSSRCEQHKVAPGTFADKRRGTRHERGYGTAWDRVRKQILRRDAGLCQPCKQAGHITPSCNTVDHIISKADRGTDEPSNLQTICNPCHTAKTAREAQQARDTHASAVGKSSGLGAPISGAPSTGGQQAGGGEKSAAPQHRTDRLATFSRAQVSRGGYTSAAGTTPAKLVGGFKLRVLP